ncbi:MAG: hypothetical protein QM704_12900 [Anaeromyxobacteraceae bacterium]
MKALLVVAAALAAAGCTMEEGPLMEPGSDCLRCHGGGGGGGEEEGGPAWSFAGTVYPGGKGVQGVTISVRDANGKTVSVRSNEAGNFYSAEKLQPPVTIWMSWGGAVRQMPALTGADVARFGRCNACHRPGGDAEEYLAPPN